MGTMPDKTTSIAPLQPDREGKGSIQFLRMDVMTKDIHALSHI